MAENFIARQSRATFFVVTTVTVSCRRPTVDDRAFVVVQEIHDGLIKATKERAGTVSIDCAMNK
jgi:hypothetical protein